MSGLFAVWYNFLMNANLKKQIWTLVGILIIAGSFFLFFSSMVNAPDHQVVIVGTRINVEIMQTAAEREQGLSGHEPLADNQGMLFIFEKSGLYGFWMKDMLFSIDIIWFTPTCPEPCRGGEVEGPARIVHIEKNVAPNTYPKVFAPKEPAQYVLELNAGLADKYDWHENDEVKF